VHPIAGHLTSAATDKGALVLGESLTDQSFRTRVR